MSAVLKQKFLSGDENLKPFCSGLVVIARRPQADAAIQCRQAPRVPLDCFAPLAMTTPVDPNRRKLPLSASRRGRGDLREQRQNMQLAVEIKLLCLTLRISDAVPKAATLLDPAGAGLDIAGVGNEPVVEFAMEGPISLVSSAPAHRVGKSGDRAGIRARQTGDDRIDQRADPLRFRREADERLTNGSVGSPGGAGDRVAAGVAPRRPEATHRLEDLILRQRIEP